MTAREGRPALPGETAPSQAGGHHERRGQDIDGPPPCAEQQPAPVAPTLRRRRRAAGRCEPLDDGRRDPLQVEPAADRLASSRRLHVEVGRRTAWLHGGKVRRMLERLGVPRLWDHRARLWCCPASRVDDVIAFAEHEGRFVTVEVIER